MMDLVFIINSVKETFFLYHCSTCFNKTAYCIKCNKVMDNLLNGIFFKCCICKLLTKVFNRESVSPDQEVRIINLREKEIQNLFQQEIKFNNNFAFNNLFIPPNNPLNFNSFFPKPQGINYLTNNHNKKLLDNRFDIYSTPDTKHNKTLYLSPAKDININNSSIYD